MTQDGEMLGSVFRVFETHIFMTMIFEKLYTSNDGMSQTKKFSVFRITRGKHGITQKSLYIIHHIFLSVSCCTHVISLALETMADCTKMFKKLGSEKKDNFVNVWSMKIITG